MPNVSDQSNPTPTPHFLTAGIGAVEDDNTHGRHAHEERAHELDLVGKRELVLDAIVQVLRTHKHREQHHHCAEPDPDEAIHDGIRAPKECVSAQVALRCRVVGLANAAHWNLEAGRRGVARHFLHAAEAKVAAAVAS